MRSILLKLASLKLALVILIALGVGVMVSYWSEVRTTWSLVIPLALLAVNLSAAVATNPAFWRQKGLLIFHLALIAVILLIAIGRLTYLRGTLELTTGIMFDGNLTSTEAGPLHNWRLKDVKFLHDGFEIDYTPGTPNQGFGTEYDTERQLTLPIGAASAPLMSDAAGARRAETRNRVRWLDAAQVWHSDLIGDNIPLTLLGYNFFTTSNKGYAPLFSWTPINKKSGSEQPHSDQPDSAEPVTGAIHLPSYPVNQYKQYLEWTPPGSNLKLWTQLQFDEVIITPYQASQFRIPEQHKMVIRHGDERYELLPGDSIDFPDGVLTYQSLSTWMGYNVDNDWTIGWLLAACSIAMASLMWHFWQKFSARPWREDEEKM